MTDRRRKLAALDWMAAMGVDEAIGEEPIDRRKSARSAIPTPEPAPPPAPAMAPAPPREPGPDAPLAPGKSVV